MQWIVFFSSSSLTFLLHLSLLTIYFPLNCSPLFCLLSSPDFAYTSSGSQVPSPLFLCCLPFSPYTFCKHLAENHLYVHLLNLCFGPLSPNFFFLHSNIHRTPPIMPDSLGIQIQILPSMSTQSNGNRLQAKFGASSHLNDSVTEIWDIFLFTHQRKYDPTTLPPKSFLRIDLLPAFLGPFSGPLALSSIQIPTFASKM